jgi:hypothetical protein
MELKNPGAKIEKKAVNIICRIRVFVTQTEHSTIITALNQAGIC